MATEHILKFYPVGNGDTSQIILSNGRRILVDFYHSSKGESDEHNEIDLISSLKKELKEVDRNYFDVVMFTHGDKDHTEGSSVFFEFDHAEKYKGNGRIKIKMLYVPAAMILESRTDLSEDYRVIQAEARYRLSQGYGILVFSRPEKLEKWLKETGASTTNMKKLCIDAGQLVPHFSLSSDGVEFFVHSPYKKHVDDYSSIERNESAIILHATFKAENKESRLFMIGDSEYHVLEDIVEITENGKHKNERRLEWDIYNIPHHCSYLALNKNGEKGETETTPTDGVKKLLQYGNKDSIFISSSNVITDDYDRIQPPHVQAYECYKKINRQNNEGSIIVTMSYPSETVPEPLEILINAKGHTLADYSSREDFIENWYQVKIKNTVKIDCEVTQDGYRPTLLRKLNLIRPNKKLRFYVVSTNVIPPFQVMWKVKNRGEFARKRNELRGEITFDAGKQEKQETSTFKGAHYVECYIIKNNECVARDKIEVPIKPINT